MSTLESDFLSPKIIEYCNQLQLGADGEFAWLKSTNFKIRDFIRTAPDFSEFRLLSQSPTGQLTTDVLRAEGIGHVELGSWYLSEPMTKWISSRDFHVSSCFLVKAGISLEQCKLFTEENDDFFTRISEGASESFPTGIISRHCRSLGAIAYLQQSYDLIIVATRPIIEAFVNSPSLFEIEEERRLKMIQGRRNFIANCGPETGPENCIEDGCNRLRIQVATRCLEHQFFAYNK